MSRLCGRGEETKGEGENVAEELSERRLCLGFYRHAQVHPQV